MVADRIIISCCIIMHIEDKDKYEYKNCAYPNADIAVNDCHEHSEDDTLLRISIDSLANASTVLRLPAYQRIQIQSISRPCASAFDSPRRLFGAPRHSSNPSGSLRCVHADGVHTLSAHACRLTLEACLRLNAYAREAKDMRLRATRQQPKYPISHPQCTSVRARASPHYAARLACVQMRMSTCRSIRGAEPPLSKPLRAPS
eukprot:2317747-Pleurochrysis_carterae.AAC.4